MSPEQQAMSEGVSVERGNERIEKLREQGKLPGSGRQSQSIDSGALIGSEHAESGLVDVTPPKPPRKPRSDKGIPKPKAAAAEPGTLTVEQRRELDSRIGSMIRTREAMHAAIAESDKAQKYYEDYLDGLTVQH